MRARFLMLWSVAVLATAASFVAHLALRHHTVQLGYDVGHSRQEQRELREEINLLRLEAETLRQPERVHAIARGHLGMSVPEPARVIPVGRSRQQQRMSGRVR